jgi:2-oxoisovalerate dehydrogenase E1 component
MEGRRIDGNNLLEVYHTIKTLNKAIRENPRPVLLECMTFRMRGHEEASGTKYVPKNLFEWWAGKDPVVNFEKYLLDEGVLLKDMDPGYLKKEFTALIETEIEKVFSETDIVPDIATEVRDMYQTIQLPGRTNH